MGLYVIRFGAGGKRMSRIKTSSKSMARAKFKRVHPGAKIMSITFVNWRK